jgi:transcriptional regulator with XRE-family HTH domain
LRDSLQARKTCTVGSVEKETIGQRITRLRNAKGWSRAELGRRMAKAVGRDKPFAGESVRRYEEGIDKPRRDGRLALAKVFDRSEQYIEFGESARQEAREPSPTYGVDVAPEVERLIRAFSWLMEDERDALLKEIEAKAVTNKAIAKQLGPRFKITGDARVLEVLQNGGDFPPGKKKAAQRRRPPTFKEEDPE